MIVGIEGRPGAGKSYYCVEHIYQTLASGRKVFTNMGSIQIYKMAWDIHRRYSIPRQKTYERFVIMQPWELNSVSKEELTNSEIIMDEIMITWFSRDWSKMDRKILEFFSQHRKYKVNFWYIAQSIDRVEGTLRDMTQEYRVMRNISYWKFFGILKLPQVFMAVHLAEDRKTIMRREWIKPIARYFNYYDSFALFNTKPGDLEAPGNVINFRRSSPAEPGDCGGVCDELLCTRNPKGNFKGPCENKFCLVEQSAKVPE